MKDRNHIFTLLFAMLFVGCDPNKELYEALDNLKEPYNRSIEYTLDANDYNSVRGIVATLQAFTEEVPAMDHIPAILARRFIALNRGSSAMVNFNYQIKEPVWLRTGFGYVLTTADYQSLGLTDNAFTPAIQAKDNLPAFLLKAFRNEAAGTTKGIIYNYREGTTHMMNIDQYQFDGSEWKWLSTRENIPYTGHHFTDADYALFGEELARLKYFSDTYPADKHMPVWMKNAYPYAIEGEEKVVRYRVLSGGNVRDEIAHYAFNGLSWDRSSDIVPKSEQYVFGAQGWAFDPTTRFIMMQSDYMYLAVIDPIPHADFNDFGYYYGASAFFSNFDMRLLARRVSKNAETGQYWDPALGAIYDSEGPEATVNEMYRRIVEEGFIKLLQHKYPQAVPQSGGIDVHYILGFETFNDNFSRSYLEAEYRCTGPAVGDNPPQFELIEGPRERQ